MSLAITARGGSLSANGIVFSFSVEDVEDLIGVEVLRIDRRGDGGVYDPVLVLSGELVLEVFSDTDLDPWVPRPATP